jgi:uncharacterized protein
MKEERVKFKSGQLKLDGLLARARSVSGSVRGAVVCHPHPLYGGSMFNNVVEAILDAMWQIGCATLRFDFRGVGASEGESEGGGGEALDAAAAVKYLVSRAGVRPDDAILAGYSFGAGAAIRAGVELKEVSTIVAVAPPVGVADLSSLAGTGKRVVLIAGDTDAYCPAGRLRKFHSELDASATLRFITGTDHFFTGCERDLASALVDALRAS